MIAQAASFLVLRKCLVVLFKSKSLNRDLPECREAEDLDEYREDIGVDHSLDLLAVARSDVTDRPAGLLPNALLDRHSAQQL